MPLCADVFSMALISRSARDVTEPARSDVPSRHMVIQKIMEGKYLLSVLG